MTSPLADRKLMAEINVVPLVDISLVLLIIFMVTTAFVKEAGLNMQLPATSSQETTPEQKNDIAIALDAGSQLYLNGRKIELADLASLLKLRAKQNNQTRVIVKADGRVNYAKIMQVLDAAKLAGLEKIALATVVKETR